MGKSSSLFGVCVADKKVLADPADPAVIGNKTAGVVMAVWLIFLCGWALPEDC